MYEHENSVAQYWSNKPQRDDQTQLILPDFEFYNKMAHFLLNFLSQQKCVSSKWDSISVILAFGIQKVKNTNIPQRSSKDIFCFYSIKPPLRPS